MATKFRTAMYKATVNERQMYYIPHITREDKGKSIKTSERAISSQWSGRLSVAHENTLLHEDHTQRITPKSNNQQSQESHLNQTIKCVE